MGNRCAIRNDAKCAEKKGTIQPLHVQNGAAWKKPFDHLDDDYEADANRNITPVNAYGAGVSRQSIRARLRN